MDDVQEKARRNLVVFSTAILGSALLDISIVSTALGVKVSNDTSPILFWSCVAAVLAYLSARFHLAPDVRKGAQVWLADAGTAVTDSMLESVQTELRKLMFHNLPPTWLTITFKAVPPTHRVIGKDGVEPTLQWNADGTGEYSDVFSTSVSMTVDGTAWEDPKHGTVRFTVTRGKYRSFQRQLYLSRYRLDWRSLEFQFPKIIAGAAAFAIAIQLFMAYYPYRSPLRFIRWVWSFL